MFEDAKLLRSLSEIRAVFALRSHRRHHAVEPQTLEMKKFLRGIRFAWEADPAISLVDLVLQLHRIVSSEDARQGLRQVNVQSRAAEQDAVTYINRTHFSQVRESLENVDRHVLRNEKIDKFDRFAIVYFEILNIHPFEDANGRVARIIASSLLGKFAKIDCLVDLTSVSRTALRQGYDLLHEGRDVNSYGLWIPYVKGLYLAEYHSLLRFAKAMNVLSSSGKGELHHIMQQILARIDLEEDAHSYAATTVQHCEKSVSHILVAALSTAGG